MKAVWETAPGALDALLAGRQFWACNLYTITLVGGGVLNYAGGDCDVVANGVRYSCGGMTGPYCEGIDNKATVHQKLGTSVDSLVFDVMPGSATVLGLRWMLAVRWRLFANALVELRRAYAPVIPAAGAWPVPVTGTVTKFTGIVGNIDSGGTAATFTVNSMMQRLQSKWPRNLYSSFCLNVLGDQGCGVNVAAYAVNGVAAAGSTALAIPAALWGAADYFDLGVVRFTGGTLAGLSRTVRNWSGGVLTLMTPFPQPPAPGDTFVVTPGCDGSQGASGCAKFANGGRFRGFPLIPAPTTAN